MEYAIETVHRGTVAVGIKYEGGIVIAVEERPKKLQIADHAQKIFQVADHIGVAAAGYIPDARGMVDNARFFAQSNKLIYDEPVGVETLSRHLADMCQSYTQYAGIRPVGVSMIVAGIDSDGKSRLYMTDPSGTYVSYDAVAIGSGVDEVTKFLEAHYAPPISMKDALVLAAAAVYVSSDDKTHTNHIRMARMDAPTSSFQTISAEDVSKWAEEAKSKFPQR